MITIIAEWYLSGQIDVLVLTIKYAYIYKTQNLFGYYILAKIYEIKCMIWVTWTNDRKKKNSRWTI